MYGEILPGLKKPNLETVRDRLDKTGLALEYFKSFEQTQHDFHGHDFIEILFVIRGRFRHVTADSSFDETAGGLTIINDHQYHSLRTPDGPVELMNVYLKPSLYPLPELPEPLGDRLSHLIPLHRSLANLRNRICHLNVRDSGLMQQLLMMLYNEQNREEPGRESAVYSLFRLVLIEICRAAPVLREDPADVYRYKIDKVCSFLEKNFTQKVRLEELCRISGLNEANLCRRFKEYTGMSTGEFLKQKRLAASVQKLRTTNDKIIHICQDCGFSDISRFNRSFKKAFGSTPSDYRKNALSRLQDQEK
ncbi:MAG: AraC family transcriptional regulator [Spirochaetales bacterium]|nr:AraC family transcriptional regulator [Spirochaetales bacterium]